MVVAVAAVLTATPAHAQLLSLTMVTPTVADFATVAMDGTPKTTTAAVSAFSVSDTRLVAVGWRVVVSATQLCERLTLAVCAVLPKTLPLGSLDQSAPTVSGPGADPTVTPAVGIDGSSVTLASAAFGTGGGTQSFSASTLTLRVPASAYARTYVTTVTWTVVSGP